MSLEKLTWGWLPWMTSHSPESVFLTLTTANYPIRHPPLCHQHPQPQLHPLIPVRQVTVWGVQGCRSLKFSTKQVWILFHWGCRMVSFFASCHPVKCVFQPRCSVIIIQTVLRGRTRLAVVRAPCCIYSIYSERQESHCCHFVNTLKCVTETTDSYLGGVNSIKRWKKMWKYDISQQLLTHMNTRGFPEKEQTVLHFFHSRCQHNG